MIDRRMVELHNEQVAYFSEKGSQFSRWPNDAGKWVPQCVCQRMGLLNKKTNMCLIVKQHLLQWVTVLLCLVFSATAVRFTPYVNCCFSPRAFYLDQSNMPPSAAPKAALIDKVRTALCCIRDIMEKLKNGIRSQSCNVEVFARVTCWNLQSGKWSKKRAATNTSVTCSYHLDVDGNQDWAFYQYNIIVVIWDYLDGTSIFFSWF